MTSVPDFVTKNDKRVTTAHETPIKREFFFLCGQ